MQENSLLTEEEKGYLGRESDEEVILEVDRGAIKFIAEAGLDSNPLYYDEEYAKKTRYGGIVAPPYFWGGPTSIRTTSLLHKQIMGLEHQQIVMKLKFCNAPNGVNSGFECEYFEPVKPGDVLRAKVKITELYEKTGRSGGIIFSMHESIYRNQEGRVAFILRVGEAHRP
ncbi:MaoC family dehydratase N-terminal domain-containing protein [Chloroflexota bacterium]